MGARVDFDRMHNLEGKVQPQFYSAVYAMKCKLGGRYPQQLIKI